VIFSDLHVEMIKKGIKIQTRRSSSRYKVGNKYGIQPGRGKKAIPEGRIVILDKWKEHRGGLLGSILPRDARCEGGYTPQEYEKLYEEMHPGWTTRWAYLFRYVPSLEAV
jgi:hypothetical protein